MNMTIHEMEIRDEAYEEGFEQGIRLIKERGIEQEKKKFFTNLVNAQRNGIITLQQAAVIAGMTEAEFLEKTRGL